jgi:hypothetical protein
MSDETPAPSADEVRAEIYQTRADLAETVDALSDKLDVKGRAKSKADEVSATAKAKAHEVSTTVAEKATELKSQAPPQVQEALDRGAAAIGPAAAKAEPYRSQIAAGAGALVLLMMVRRRRKRRKSE